MQNDKYSTVFTTLGIPVQPLPSNYSPEEFGRRLISMSQTEHGVSYAASTECVKMPQMVSEIIKDEK